MPKVTVKKLGQIKAVGFDFGETLGFYQGAPLSWKALYQDALHFAAAACDFAPTPEQTARAAAILELYNTRINPRTVEVTSDEIFGQVLEAWGLRGAERLDAISTCFFHFFQRQVAPYEDTIVVLRSLRQAGVRTGVLTDVPYGMNSALLEQDFAAAGNLRDFLDVVLTSVQVGLRKPEPQGFRQLARELGVEPREMLFVGNEKKDVVGANRAGVFSVLLDRDHQQQEWGQKARITTLHELLPLLDTDSLAIE